MLRSSLQISGISPRVILSLYNKKWTRGWVRIYELAYYRTRVRLSGLVSNNINIAMIYYDNPSSFSISSFTSLLALLLL